MTLADKAAIAARDATVLRACGGDIEFAAIHDRDRHVLLAALTEAESELAAALMVEESLGQLIEVEDARTEGLEEALRDCALAGRFGREAMDQKVRGGREKLDYIQRRATIALEYDGKRS